MLPLFFIVFFSLFVLVFRSDLYLSKHIYISFSTHNFKLFMCFFFVLIFLFTNLSVYVDLLTFFLDLSGVFGSVRRFHISQIIFVQFFLGLFSLFNWITETVWAGVLRRRQAAPMESVRLVFFVAGGADGWLRGCRGMRRRRGREKWETTCSVFFLPYKCKKTFHKQIFVNLFPKPFFCNLMGHFRHRGKNPNKKSHIMLLI